ncbi:MAG: hypothetical protein WCW52_09845 [Elusimicrobiales bacterium]|jgi:hypothetical protein
MPEFSEAELFLKDRAAYYRALVLRNEYTSLLLRKEEMADPYPAYRRRWAEAIMALESECGKVSGGKTPAQHCDLQRQEELGAIIKQISDILVIFERPGNGTELKSMSRKTSRNGFIKQRRHMIEELSTRFEDLAKFQKVP